MTDNEKAKAFFEHTNRNWPGTKTTWEGLGASTQALWVERMKQREAAGPAPQG